jgi:hypothetical protein
MDVNSRCELIEVYVCECVWVCVCVYVCVHGRPCVLCVYLSHNKLPARDITTTKFKETTVQPAERWACVC